MDEIKAITEMVWRAPGPVAAAALSAMSLYPDDVIIMTGPVASGKNGWIAACIARAFAMQAPSADGVKHLKVVIARMTYSRLIAATIPSFLDWFPESVGRLVKGSSPITYEIKTDDTHLQVWFVAIDRPEEASRIMGADLSFAVIDEAREVDESVLSALLTRVGRFPALRDCPSGAAFRGIIITSNKSDTRHWLYRACVSEPRKYFHWFDQPSALSPDAENLSSLPGGREWYARKAASLPPDQVEVFIKNQWGFVADGIPVFREFSALAHVSREVLAPVRNESLIIGADIGPTIHPGAVIMQFLESGRVLVLAELYSEGQGAQQFGAACRAFVSRHFHDNPVECVYADPAGSYGTGSDASLPSEVFAAVTGWKVRPSPARSMVDRIEVGQSVLARMVEGIPALRISPSCTVLTSGLANKYCYKQVSSSSGPITSDQILKLHPESDVTEAFLYALAGAGEYGLIREKIALTQRSKRKSMRRAGMVYIAEGVPGGGRWVDNDEN